MTRFGLTASFVLALLALPDVRAMVEDDVKTVTVTGTGISERAARHDALRNALEQGAGVEISARSEVRDFALIRDTIYARADGIVTDFEILEQGDATGGVKFCRLRATVSRKAVASHWGELQNVLEQVGRPGVAVYIDERIDGVLQESSILETQIEHRLLEVGFNVYAGSQLRAIAERESADAAANGNVAKMQAIAKNFGARIFITGTAGADAAGVRDLAGQAVAMYNCDAAIKMYHTDTGQLLASESLANRRGGARGFNQHSRQGGKKALENAGAELVEACYQNVMKRWATRISAGGELVLEVEGMRMIDVIKLRKKLLDLDPDRIRAVNHSLSKGVATFRIKARMTAEELAEHLVADDWAAIIEVIDLSANRLQAKKVGS